MAGGQKGGAEGDLDARSLGEPGECVGQGQLLDGEAGGGGEEGAGFGFDAGPAAEQGDLLQLLRGEGGREEGGDEDEGGCRERCPAGSPAPHDSAPVSRASIRTVVSPMVHCASITLHTTVMTSSRDFPLNHIVRVLSLRAGSLISTSLP